jgi:hypothetical protein
MTIFFHDHATGQSSPRLAMKRNEGPRRQRSATTVRTNGNVIQHSTLMMTTVSCQLSKVYDDLEEHGIPLLDRQTHLSMLKDSHETFDDMVPDKENSKATNIRTPMTTASVTRSDQQLTTSILPLSALQG